MRTSPIHVEGAAAFLHTSWVNLNYPHIVGWTSDNSVAGNQVVGIVIGNTGKLAYQATVNTDVPSARA